MLSEESQPGEIVHRLTARAKVLHVGAIFIDSAPNWDWAKVLH